MSKKHFPSVFVVSGAQDFLRRRFLNGVVKGQQNEGWLVEYVDGSVTGELRDSLNQGGSFFESDEDRKTLIVVSNPEKADLELIKEHVEEQEPDAVLLLDLEGEPKGNTKFGQFVKALGKNAHSNHPKPAFWDEVEVAARFCVTEAKSRGKILEENLANELARKVGTDLGFLAFEIQKMAMLADIDQSETIRVDHVQGGKAVMSEAILSPLTDALIFRNRNLMAISLNQIRKSSKRDPTLRIAGFLWATVSKWLAVSEFLKSGVGLDEGASKLKLNPWFFKNKLVPQVQRWPCEDVLKLVHVLAGAERSVLNGNLNPWVVLVTGLLGVCGTR
ncbi:MAG: hypothetical protein WC824_10305 [Bacteroidota bacterium]|jgi:DNA polymerase III delta subunit